MKRKLFAAILWILVVCIALPALAEDVPPVIDVPSDPCASGHSWGEWRIIREATCATEGIQTHTCTVCGKEDQGVIPKTDNHAWGDWKITIEATCLASGLKSRTCSVCGRTENEGIPKNEHSWSGWEITKEPTCTESGNKRRTCSRCGGTENKKIKALGHDAEEWTVTKEPTCQKTGEKEGTCIRCGKALTKKLNKVDHGFDEWEILEPATDFSKGKRESVCRFCKRKKTEEFYPAGTLAKELENDPDEMKALQTELKALGLYNREPNGKYDKATVEAINKAEKGLGLKQDGICWPGLRKLLLGPEGGVTADGDESIGPDPSKYKMQLSVKRVSSRKDYYEAGDEITYEWTLKNTSNAVCRKAKIYHYETDSKGNKRAETEIGNAGNLKPGESNTGLYIYTVTKEDEASGKIRHGLISRGNIGGKASSNPCLFMHFSLAGAGGKGGWTLPGTGILSVTVTADNEPENKFFFVKGETIRFRIEVRNKTTGDVNDIVVTDSLFGDGWKETIGTLAGGESRTVDAEYTVTARDAIAGEVVSAAKVSCTQNREAGTAAGEARAKTGTNTYGLHVFNTCTSVPKNGRFFVPGETVEFEIRVTNPTTDDTFRAPEIYDRLYSRVKAYKKEGQLKPGKTVTYTFKTKVTEYQGKTGKLTNYVLVRYKDPDRKPMVSRSNDCTVPCGIEGQESIVVTEKVVSTPDDGDFFTEGEEIRYRIEIANNTGRNITGAEIRNTLADMDSNGYRTLRSSETLRAGETCTVEFSYYVTGEDVANTKVTSRASVKWASGKDETTETCSETVTVATAPSVSSQTPGMRSLAGEACRPALTAIGEGTALRELTRCAAHAATAQEAEGLPRKKRTQTLPCSGTLRSATCTWSGRGAREAKPEESPKTSRPPLRISWRRWKPPCGWCALKRKRRRLRRKKGWKNAPSCALNCIQRRRTGMTA